MMLMNDSMGKEGGRTEFTGMMHNYRISSIRRRGYYFFFAAHFCVATIRRQRLFLWKVRRHQQRLDKVRTRNTVTTVRFSAVSTASQSCCQLWNESYSLDSFSASLVTIIRSYSHKCAAYSSRGYYSWRAVFISLRAPDCTATIQGWRLFKEIQHSEHTASQRSGTRQN